MLSMKWRMILFSIPALLLVFYAHVYLYRRLVVLLTSRTIVRRALVIVSVLAITTGVLSRFLYDVASPDVTRTLATVANIWTGFLLYLLFLTVMLNFPGHVRERWRRRRAEVPIVSAPIASPERRVLLQTGIA